VGETLKPSKKKTLDLYISAESKKKGNILEEAVFHPSGKWTAETRPRDGRKNRHIYSTPPVPRKKIPSEE